MLGKGGTGSEDGGQLVHIEANSMTFATKKPAKAQGGGGVALGQPAEDFDEEVEVCEPTLTVALTKPGPQPTLIVCAAGM